jgi:phosphoenolpyruvate synthase/pyruvate phosphate dikinase
MAGRPCSYTDLDKRVTTDFEQPRFICGLIPNPIGICREHGGDPESVKFCHRIGLDYVSCSPFRVPVAKPAAAQAALAG